MFKIRVLKRSTTEVYFFFTWDTLNRSPYFFPYLTCFTLLFKPCSFCFWIIYSKAQNNPCVPELFSPEHKYLSLWHSPGLLTLATILPRLQSAWAEWLMQQTVVLNRPKTNRLLLLTLSSLHICVHSVTKCCVLFLFFFHANKHFTIFHLSELQNSEFNLD